MLVLSRKRNEGIVINNDISVFVVEIRGDKVRLGIVAPREVPVHRQEVYDLIHGRSGDGWISLAVTPSAAPTEDLVPDYVVELSGTEDLQGQRICFTAEGTFYREPPSKPAGGTSE
jgi:carbon storage regulator